MIKTSFYQQRRSSTQLIKFSRSVGKVKRKNTLYLLSATHLLSMPGSKKQTCRISKANRRLRTHLPLVQHLVQAGPSFWSYAFQHLTNDQILFLQDIVRNFLRGNVPVSEREIRELSLKKKPLRSFGGAKSFARRRVLIKQVGGGIFGVLIPAVASLIGSLLRH